MLSKLTDFYSTSGFRDLIFNENEHTFCLNEINNEILKQDLTFLGFEEFQVICKNLKLSL